MAKKKSGRASKAAAAGHVSDDDDRASVASADTIESIKSMTLGGAGGSIRVGGAYSEDGEEKDGGVETEAVDGDSFSTMVDQLTEKRASTREAALKKVADFMLHAGDAEPVLAMQETLMSALMGILRKPSVSVAEGVGATRALSVLCVLIGADENAVFREVSRPLMTLITRCRYTEVRVGACQALCVACFICSSDEDNTGNVMESMGRVFSRLSEGLHVPEDLCCAALDGWGLLATIVSREWVATTATDLYLETFHSLLQTGDMDVRRAAGEDIALLHECRLETGHAVDDDDVEGAELWADIVARMQELSVESSKKLSKDVKKQQRRTFRELCATLAEDEPPTEVVTLQNGSLTVNSWVDIKQLNAMRAVLKSGLQVQLQHNAVLREILGVSGWGGTAGEHPKYSKKSAVTKLRTSEMARSRGTRQNVKDHFLHVDGDDT